MARSILKDMRGDTLDKGLIPYTLPNRHPCKILQGRIALIGHPGGKGLSTNANRKSHPGNLQFSTGRHTKKQQPNSQLYDPDSRANHLGLTMGSIVRLFFPRLLHKHPRQKMGWGTSTFAPPLAPPPPSPDQGLSSALTNPTPPQGYVCEIRVCV